MTHDELAIYLRIVDRLAVVQTLDEVSHCVTHDLRRLWDCGSVIGGLARVHDGAVFPELLVHRDFPSDYLDEIRQSDASVRSPVLARWLRRPMPMAIDFTRPAMPLDAATRASARRFRFDNLLAHGHLAPRSGWLSYFSFHRLPVAPSAELKRLLVRLMPHLHGALTRLAPQPRGDAVSTLDELSERQHEIAHWLLQGKSNWEIAQIAETSEANVKYHLAALMRRFEVCNRTALVFKLCAAPEPSPPPKPD